MTAIMADDELLINRRFNARVPLVFALWSQPQHFRHWLGPKDFDCTHLEMDFREGGKYRACISSATYGDSWMEGTYRQIIPNQRIVMSFRWANGEPDPETIITITLKADGNQTIQSFHQAPFGDVPRRDSHVSGWNECFDREALYLDTQEPQHA